MESKSEGRKPPRTRPAATAKHDGTEDELNPDRTSPKRVFVVSPIGTPGTDIYKRAQYALKFIFKRALPAPEWEVHRADEGKLFDSIGQHVIRSIMDADLIIADLTGHNPNVFYELAVAHASRKPVVHLISKGERLPFDVFDQRTIHYDISDLESVEEAVEEVRAYADAVMGQADEVVNPLTNYVAFDRIRGDGTGESANDALADLLEQVVARLSNLEQTVTISRARDYRIRQERAFDPLTDDALTPDRAARRERERAYMRDQAYRQQANELSIAERRQREQNRILTVEDLGRVTKEDMDGEQRRGGSRRPPESAN
ncbi:nucleoside 2-deoxyribosyltransferase [Arthrobacter sp. SORGH_AS 212]|uniref:hypothetical protein n=1 Tax=Pseudarthrobacter sp. SORGH_AS 212 TaxID=3041777 RepID=UPI00278B1810|nr:nucleoside 2-deoxyribosyltransferase [Arthrobacter sp. SORGH_AS_0212]